MSKYFGWIVGAAALVVLAAGAAAIRFWVYEPALAIGTRLCVPVSGGILRSKQPSADELVKIHDQYHIRTVVNLRGKEPNQKWWVDEDEFCRRNGLELINIDMNARGLEAENLRRFLTAATNADRKPLLVHCQAGVFRTGFAVAGYRIVVDKWSFDRAIAEARSYGFNSDDSDPFVQILKALGAGADWRTVGRGGATSTSTTSGIPN